MHRRAARTRGALTPDAALSPQGAALAGRGWGPSLPDSPGESGRAGTLTCTGSRTHGQRTARVRKHRQRPEHVPPGPSVFSQTKRGAARSVLCHSCHQSLGHRAITLPHGAPFMGEEAPLGTSKRTCDEQTCSDTLILKVGGPGQLSGACACPWVLRPHRPRTCAPYRLRGDKKPDHVRGVCVYDLILQGPRRPGRGTGGRPGRGTGGVASQSPLQGRDPTLRRGDGGPGRT